jgi:hypothetical protein
LPFLQLVSSTASENYLIAKQHQIRTRELQSPPTKDSADVKTRKEAMNAKPLQGVKGVENTSAISSKC